MTQQPDIAGHLVGGRYEIERPLASGGMATVYVARHHLTRQRVALKVIAAVFARDEAGVARFLREVSVASRIGHDGVVKVFDAGFDDALGAPYLAMELLEGRSLAQLLAEQRVHQADAMRHALAMMEPLAAAHDAGVIHRDLKPENVFVARSPDGRDTVKLLDFGVARDLRGSRTATMEGAALGTVYYMAPEQALDARAATAAADVYAMGVILYQVICGIFPFDGTTPHAVIIRANREVAVPVAERAPGVDPRLAALIDRCLSKSPDDRPADAASLRGLLAPLLADPAIDAWLSARPVNPATFLSTPPPSSEKPFDDPFAPPPARGTSLSSPPPEVWIASSSVEVTPPPPAIAPLPTPAAPAPPRRTALWVAAVLIPLAITVALVAGRAGRTSNAAPAPAAAVPAPAAPAPVLPAPVLPAPAAPAPAPVAEAPAPVPTIAAPAPTPTTTRRARDRSPPNDPPPAQAPTLAQPEPVVAAPAPVVAAPAPVVAAPAPAPVITAAPSPAVAPPPRPVPTAPPPEHAQEQQPSAPPFVSF